MEIKQKQDYLDQITFSPLTEEYLEQAVEILYYSFKTQNPLWQAVPSTFEEVRSHFIRRARASFPKQTSFIALRDNIVVCCYIILDFQDYMELRKQEVNLEFPELFKIISKAQGQFLDMLKNEQEPEKCLYGYYGGVHPDARNTLVFPLTTLAFSKYALQKGYKDMYGLLTSPRVSKIYSHYVSGLKEVQLQSDKFPQVNGYQFYFGKLQLINISNKLVIQKPSL